MYSVVVPSKERISIGSLGSGVVERAPVQPAPPPRSPTHSSPRAEVVDEPEADVAERRPVGDGEREGEERDPALRVHRPVDRVDDDVHRAAGAERPHAELLRDEDEIRAEGLEPGDDRVLGSRVDRGRVVAALAGAEHGLTLGAGRQRLEHGLDVGDAGAAEGEPVVDGRHTGWKRRPLVSFGKK